MAPKQTQRMVMLVSAAFIAAFLSVACQTTSEGPSATAQPVPTQTGEETSAEQEAYRLMVDRAMGDIGLLAPGLSRIGIQLSGAPEEAPQAAEVVQLTLDAFSLTREQLAAMKPPVGYDQLHGELLNALGLYAQAAEALLPDPETRAADYWAFQGLMEQAGGNAHTAGATLGVLNASR